MKRLIVLGVVTLAASVLSAADLPRQRLLLDSHWRFHLGEAPDAGNQFVFPEVKTLAKTHIEEVGLAETLAARVPDPVAVNLGGGVSFVQPKCEDNQWRELDLPHDWAVELPFSAGADLKHGFKPVGEKSPQGSIGWYRREFELPASDRGKALWIEFDGVYRNCLVWLNGHCLGRNVSGYSSFRFNISRFANCGGTNLLVVRVDASRFEGWFYEGSGIYRHVWLVKTSPLAVAPDGTFVYSKFLNNEPKGIAEIHVQSRLVNAGLSNASTLVRCELVDPNGTRLGQTLHAAELKAGGERELEAQFFLCPPGQEPKSPVPAGDKLVFHSPELWSPETPRLYKLVTTVESGGRTVDRVETEFGIRTVAFDADKGFLLNGKPYTIKGTCNHQDHAGVGTALPDALQYFRVKKLKEMGSNAYRAAHNPPTPELLQACDRLGMLVMDENRRMDTSSQTLDELKRLVLRDRNHPSVFIWSLGNEEFYLQGRTSATITKAMTHEAAVRIATVMQDLVHTLDPTRLCTVAMNGGWGEGLSEVVDVQGFNYRTKDIDGFHAKFPKQPTIGTETASTRTTRGVYADDKPRGYVAAYGENGVSTAWGWWPYFATHPFTSGGFVWTGFDYRGEPTPYKWPCINSHFGIMDMCGFAKDIYYYYQSWWTDKPVLHLMPHWNWPGKEGQPVLVRCFSNCKAVELLLNGRSLGRQAMQSNQYLDWNVAYEPGVLSARGFDGNKVVVESKVETTGVPVAIELSPNRSSINADGRDVSILSVSVVDAQGRVVPTADNLVHFELSGPGRLLGVGNGDPSSHEPDQANQRTVFNGLAQVLVQSSERAGVIRLTATAPALHPATLQIQSKSGQ